MARYGSFVYSDGTKYGTLPVTTDLLWTFLVDWDGDGYFSGENEALQMSDLSMERGRDNLIQASGEGFERYRTGRATAVLDNYDGRYNAINTLALSELMSRTLRILTGGWLSTATSIFTRGFYGGISLYTNVTPGKAVRLAVKNGNLGDNFALMTGTIEDIQPFNQDNHDMVRMEIVDGQEWLGGRTVRIGRRSYTGDLSSYWTTGHVVDLILEMANWPEIWGRSYSTLEDYQDGIYKGILHSWFWLRDALESIRELEDAEGVGIFLHARGGSARFFERDFSQDKIIPIDAGDVLIDITVPQPWEFVKNQIQVRVHQIKLHDLDTILWQIGGDDDAAILVEAGESFRTEAEFKYFNYAVVPANETIVWDFGSTPDGTPDDLDGNVVVVIDEKNTPGDGATITFYNTGGVDGYIRDLYVFGDAIFAKYNNWITEEDDDSIDLYGARVFKLASPWIEESADAQIITDNLLAKLAAPMPYPTIKILGQPDKQFGIELYADRIQFDFPNLGISQLFRVGKIEHAWAVKNGQTVMTTLKLEPDLAIDAPESAEYDYFWEFEDDEGWSLQTDWDYYNEGLRADLSGSVTRTASISGLTAAVTAGAFVSFTYKFSFQQDMDDAAVLLQVTYDSGAFNEFVTVPIEASQEGIQYFYDASGYAGTYAQITGLSFVKVDTVPLDGEFFLDDVGIGILA